MKRVSDWDVRLADAVEAARHRPFAWGAHDCATWAFDVRAALTGRPSAAEAWRGRYKTEIGAIRMVRRLGYDDLRGMMHGLLGGPLANPRLAQRGDIVISTDQFPAIAVVIGAQAVFPGETGLMALPIRSAEIGWRV